VADVSAPSTVRSATRRLVGLTALRWLPVGLTAPVTVLLAQSRGLTLQEVGLLFMVHGLVILALELPTGGLADALGRRPVVIAGIVLHIASCAVVVVSDSFAGFVLGVVLLGIGRTLDSGPVEAWYVDTVHRIDPRADVTPGLSLHSAADGGGLALGALVGGLLPGLTSEDSGTALALPFVAAAVLDLVYLAAVVGLLSEGRPARQGTAVSALVAGAREVPATVRDAVRLSVTDGPLRLVLLLTAVGGVALVACELLGPGRFAALAGSPDDGAAVYGTVLAASFAAAAVAAVTGPSLRRLLRGSTRITCAALSLLGAAGLMTLAGPDVLLLAALSFGTYYVAHGATWPLLSTVLHSRVGAAHRATAVSAMSLAMAVGGMLGNLSLPPVVRLLGTDGAFVAVGAVVLLSALLCLRLPAGTSEDEEALPDQPLHDGQHLLGGLGLADPGAAGQDGQQVAEPAGPVAPGEQRRAVRVDPA
jgi:hypothetical protein